MRFIVVLFCAAFSLFALSAHAQQKEIKIGFVYDVTGPFAGGGSEPAQVGTKAAIDYFNEKGGVMGYKINAIFADAQSKVDVAINEMTRLYDQEKVDLVMGLYSSAQCVPMAQQADARKKFLWINVCVASSVLKDKKFTYVFRPTVHSDQYGFATCEYVHNYSQSKFGIVPKNMRIAIIHEDGPYGAGVASANDIECKKMGMNVVMKEGYAASSPDLSSLVTKLKRARPDVILHTGYNPDITLFLRQAKEQGLKFKLPQKQIAFFFGPTLCKFSKDNADWESAEETITIMDVAFSTLAKSGKIEAATIEAVIAFHAQPKALPFMKILEPFIPAQLAALDGDVRTMANIIKWDKRKIIIDGSAQLANGLFLRLDREFEGTSTYQQIAEQLRADEEALFAMLDVKEDRP